MFLVENVWHKYEMKQRLPAWRQAALLLFVVDLPFVPALGISCNNMLLGSLTQASGIGRTDSYGYDAKKLSYIRKPS